MPNFIPATEDSDSAAKRTEPGDVRQVAILCFHRGLSVQGRVGKVVVYIYKVDGREAPKFPRKTRGKKGYAHAFADGVDECFDTPIA
jgi:hypothetical protein